MEINFKKEKIYSYVLVGDVIKKITRDILFLPLIIIFLILFSGCTTKNDTNNFIGSWEMKPLDNANQNESNTYIFYKNGSFISKYIDLDRNENHTGWGYYSIKENSEICMNTHSHGAITDNDSICYNYEFTEDYNEVKLVPKELSSLSEIILIRFD